MKEYIINTEPVTIETYLPVGLDERGKVVYKMQDKDRNNNMNYIKKK